MVSYNYDRHESFQITGIGKFQVLPNDYFNLEVLFISSFLISKFKFRDPLDVEKVQSHNLNLSISFHVH